jgi:hypothetical protein
MSGEGDEGETSSGGGVGCDGVKGGHKHRGHVPLAKRPKVHIIVRASTAPQHTDHRPALPSAVPRPAVEKLVQHRHLTCVCMCVCGRDAGGVGAEMMGPR